MADPTKSESRLVFLDWTRGLAAFIMLQGHSFHSFTRKDLRASGPYMLSQFVGGIAPAIFLFLAGVTFSFLMDGGERRGVDLQGRLIKALKRAGYLFFLAFAFRTQLYLFGLPGSPPSELLKVDVLNCMGLSTLIFVPMAFFSTMERVRLCAFLGVVIAGLSPFVTMLDAPAIPWLIRAYFIPSYDYFGFFPWAAFLAFGMSCGAMLRSVESDQTSRIMQWLMLTGIGLIMSGQYVSNLPYSLYPKSDFWLDSPGLTFIKLGVVLALMSFIYFWFHVGVRPRWSLLRQLGTTSLLVYWVHIELVYGRWFGSWKEALTIPQVTLFAVILIAAMTVLSILRKRIPNVDSLLRAPATSAPSSSTGD